MIERGRLKPSDIVGVGLSGQMHGSVFLDDRGDVIRPALLWNDQRTAAQCAEIEEKAGGREALVKMVADRATTGFTARSCSGFAKTNQPRGIGCAKSCFQRITSVTDSRVNTRPRSAMPPAHYCSTLPTDVGARNC